MVLSDLKNDALDILGNIKALKTVASPSNDDVDGGVTVAQRRINEVF